MTVTEKRNVNTRKHLGAARSAPRRQTRFARVVRHGLSLAIAAAAASCAQPDRTVRATRHDNPTAQSSPRLPNAADDPKAPHTNATGTKPLGSATARAQDPSPQANDAAFEAAAEDAAGPAAYAPVQTVEQVGVMVECTLTPLATDRPRSVVQAGDSVEVRFQVTDTTTNAPLTGLNPAAWIDRRNESAPETCHDKIQSFLVGNVSARAEFDLNEFYVLALNDEPSITVVDPLFSYGGSRLLAMVQLPARGEDWVQGLDGRLLYVTMPLVNQVAVVDTRTWKLIEAIEVGTQPTRIRLQPDGKYLWVSSIQLSTTGTKGEVYAVDTQSHQVAGQFSLGKGHHDFAFSPDSRFAYVSTHESGSVAVLDVQSLAPIATVAVGASAQELAYSKSGDTLYVVNGVDGEVVAIDGLTHTLISRIPDAPGLGAIKTAPDDRFVLVANADTDTVHVIDVASNTIIQTADVGPGPDQIAFTLNLAYIRSKRSEIVLMIPLDQVGKDGPLSVVDFTGGHAPFGLAKTTSLAAGIAPAPSGVATVVANPVDKAIYYYKEGMAAPMGEFTNYGREPRAVLVVDRSLHESSPGVYSTTVQLPRNGRFDVAFLLDAPRVVHCFDLDVARRPGEDASPSGPPIEIEPTYDAQHVVAGAPVRLGFRIRDARSGKLVTDLADLDVLAFSTNNWQQRKAATNLNNGEYEVRFVPPHSGVYYVFCRVPSLDLDFKKLPFSTLRVVDPHPGD